MPTETCPVWLCCLERYMFSNSGDLKGKKVLLGPKIYYRLKKKSI